MGEPASLTFFHFQVKKERLVTTLTQKKIVNAHISAVSQYTLKEV